MDTYIVAYNGLMGSGKTSKAICDALLLQNETGCKIYTNFGMVGQNRFEHFSDFEKIAVEPSSIIILDECHMDLDARDYNSNSVKNFTKMVNYLRKIRCVIFLTTPNFFNIDTKIRDLTSYICECRKRGDYQIFEYYDLQNDNLIKSQYTKSSDLINVIKDQFNTYSMVTPLNYPKDKEGYLEVFENVMNLNQKYIFENSVNH